MIESIKDWIADRFDVLFGIAFAIIMVLLLGGLLVSSMQEKQRCHDAGGHWVSQKSGGQCWRGERIHP